jgi:hypothetical protein
MTNYLGMLLSAESLDHDMVDEVGPGRRRND